MGGLLRPLRLCDARVAAAAGASPDGTLAAAGRARKWEGEAGEGGLINVQHKVVRGRVAAEAMAQLQSLGDSAAA